MGRRGVEKRALASIRTETQSPYSQPLSGNDIVCSTHDNLEDNSLHTLALNLACISP